MAERGEAAFEIVENLRRKVVVQVGRQQAQVDLALLQGDAEQIGGILAPLHVALGVEIKPLAPRLDTIDGKTIAFLWDDLFRGDEIWPIL